MKKLLTIATVSLLLASCGAIDDQCGSDIRMGCNAIFGVRETPEVIQPSQPTQPDNSTPTEDAGHDSDDMNEEQDEYAIRRKCEQTFKKEKQIDVCVQGHLDIQDGIEEAKRKKGKK